MIFKQIEICNVGRFKSAKTIGDSKHFKKSTFVYGKNTFGKSTLTSIFRSLKENDQDYIVGRKTIGTQNQKVKLIPDVVTPIGEYRYTTPEAKWSAEFKDLIIFDNHFVHESVYTQSQQIGKEQQKSIEAFMLGSTGAEYNARINSLTEQISKNTRIQTATSGEYSRNKHLLGGLAFDKFLELIEVKDADSKIVKAQNDVDRQKNSTLISGKLTGIKQLLERYKNFDVKPLSTNLTLNEDLIVDHFKEHVNQRESKHAYDIFLQMGSKLRSRKPDERCPFCTQQIGDGTAANFFSAIDLIYNNKYKELQKVIGEAENLFSDGSFSVSVGNIEKDLQQAGYALEIDFSDIDELFAPCEKAIKDKKDDLSNQFDTSPFDLLFERVKAHITAIDAELVTFQNPADQNIRLKKVLDELRANKERFGPWKARCDEYIKARNDNQTISTEKALLWDEYLRYAGGLSSSMLADINAVLTAASCNFSVREFNFMGNQRQDLLVLTMGGGEISNEGENSEMTVKNSLSDSDKWILALAFFLATVKNDASIKVVVMDDPVSSFDSDRKRIILKEIKKVLDNTGKQLILLTHEKSFYHLLHSEYSADNESVFLKILFDGQGSDFDVCNPDEDAEFMSEFNCWIFDMKKANSSQDLSFVRSAHSNIRRVIEHLLKSKYPLELTKEYDTVEKMLTRLEQVGGPYATISRRSDIYSILINESHHDNSGATQYPAGLLGVDDYKNDIRNAFAVIKLL